MSGRSIAGDFAERVLPGKRLELRSLRVAYGMNPPALEGVSFDVSGGELVALIGPNGAGKTTLIRALSGVIRPQAGSIHVLGKNLATLSEVQRASSLAVVPQARNLPPGFTVWQTVLLGRTPYLGWLGQPDRADRQRVVWALQRTHLYEMKDRLVGELSGGEQQRVLLARALAQETPILLLDEPTSHLDLRYQSDLLGLVRELAQEHDLAVIMALHDLNLAGIYADRVALLVEGRLCAIGAPAEVLTPQNLAAAFQIAVHVIPHPEYGTPLVLPDGWKEERERVAGV